ncbi:C-type lectin domain family 4 member M-like [Branchiostoma floridae]|uniref:C-type lectin domain family 4 member M-like n=1 Tax=Branchiostoma floridae TaxID=7739 RepID=A0A9J7MVM5_BRAFL|nr:C-type lectin domain family 4 member M-like [Branchiostoma floridae]
MRLGICYKAFDTRKTWNEAAAACGEDGGTLTMPRDTETNAFLISLYKSVSDSMNFLFGLHDRREEGLFEWVDGSALGTYNSWGPREPNNAGGFEDCVRYHNDKWNDGRCDYWPAGFICHSVPAQWEGCPRPPLYAFMNVAVQTNPRSAPPGAGWTSEALCR